jgi:hypothetical protein
MVFESIETLAWSLAPGLPRLDDDYGEDDR